MKTFAIILAVAGLASADVSLGYQYNPPKLQTSYGTPSYSISSGNGGFNSGYTGQNTGSVYKGQSNLYQTSAGLQNGYPSQVQTNGAGYPGNIFQSGAAGYHSGSGYQTGTGYQTGNGYQAGGHYAGAGLNGNQHQSGGSFGHIGVSSGSLQGAQGLNQYQTSNQYQSNSANYQQYYSQFQHQAPQIFKHFYVHAAPEEPEVARPRQPVVLPAPQKHYKIIFIKTPAPAVGSTQFVPVQQQNEEKTIVYVLVKKPEVTEDVVIPKIEQKPPSKPEVFFIKYKGKEDSQAVINNIVNEYNSGKETVNVEGAFHSGNSGTLDAISDVKYVSQSSSQLASNGAGAVQAVSGSSGSQYESSGGSVGQSSSSGSYDTGSSGSGFQSQSFGSSSVNYPSSTAGYLVSTAAPVQIGSGTGGYDSSSSAFSSTVSSTGGHGAISSSQGIPHETYGTPNFRNN